jgi:hypothetical protein
MFLTSGEAVLRLAAGNKAEKPVRPAHESVLRMKFVGANPRATVAGQEELPGKANYFIGNDPKLWLNNVSTFARVRYEDVYPGIDLIYRGNQRQLEYDFVVRPGANARSISLRFEGTEQLELDADGSLVLYMAGGKLRHLKPFIYQEVEGLRQEISGGYVLSEKNQVGFHVASYDPGNGLRELSGRR